MYKFLLLFVFICVSGNLLYSEDATPLDQKLTPGSETMITCFANKSKKPNADYFRGTSEDLSKGI